MKASGFGWVGLLVLVCLGVRAQTAAPTSATSRGLKPPPGIAVPESVRHELTVGAAELETEIRRLRTGTNTLARSFWPDVAVFHKAVDWALRYDEFHSTNQFAQARQLLALGRERAVQLAAGNAPWISQTGPVIRGFVSRVDDSVQPCGLVVPPSWRPGGPAQRLDVWLAGRDERRTELKFVAERLRSTGEFAPAETVVVHPYGRYCNAYKFAGETDVFEAVAFAERAYGTDPKRRAIRGFSMGGAGTWHLAAHHPEFWRAAAPGAGFADTARYTGVLQEEPQLPEWEQRLWRWYDAPVYAANLRYVETLAYSGELDRQKLAADTMAAAMASEGLQLRHLVGPGVEHRYEPATKAELARQFDAVMATPKAEAPSEIEFVTATLRYPSNGQLYWLGLERLERHWEPARIRARVQSATALEVQVTNVARFRLGRPPGLGSAGAVVVRINGQPLRVSAQAFRSTAHLEFAVEHGRWRRVRGATRFAKHPGLEGPIDAAFLERFLVIRPTGTAWNAHVGAWSEAGLTQFVADWRAQFRGDVRVKDDTAVTEMDLRESHLILWGDPGSNRLLARLVGRLPLRWTRDRLTLKRHSWDAKTHVPVLIQPNPLRRDRYVVLNSGHTFAAWNGTNARQTPRLPDWAVLNLEQTGTADSSVTLEGRGAIQAAGFFDEQWQATGSAWTVPSAAGQ